MAKTKNKRGGTKRVSKGAIRKAPRKSQPKGGARARVRATASSKSAAPKSTRPGRAKSSSALPSIKPSTQPWGQAGKALEGVRILDFTHVQSGPTCTQLLAWLGADVIKVERPGGGDITRGQLRDVPNADSLYFTMLNHNKRSITIDSKHPKGKAILDRLIERCDVLVENFAPGALDRMGLTWEHINNLNPRMIVASVKGFGPGPYADCKVYENVAQCAGGSASTTGFRDGPPLVTGAQIGDSGTGLHLALGIVSALYQRHRTGRGQKVLVAMQDGVLNLCRVKLRDQQRLKHGPLTEYSQYGENIPFGAAVPRAGNDSGGGQPGWILKCKGWEDDPNAYIYFITQAPVWEAICEVIGEPTWKSDPDYATPTARLPRLRQIFARIEQWTTTKTKFEAMEILNRYDIPCGPILSMKELAEDESLRKTGTVVEVDHPGRGRYLTVGNPIKLSDSPTDVIRSPLLGEHTEQILTELLDYGSDEVADIKESGAVSTPQKRAAAA
jgi:formyl-CoA transferase